MHVMLEFRRDNADKSGGKNRMNDPKQIKDHKAKKIKKNPITRTSLNDLLEESNCVSAGIVIP